MQHNHSHSLLNVDLCNSSLAAGMPLVDLTDTELLEESGIGKTSWHVYAKNIGSASKLGLWWLGKFEKIGTKHGHDVLEHKDYADVYCCYNEHEGCWQVQSPGKVHMVAKEYDWHVDYEVTDDEKEIVVLVLLLPDDEEEIEQPQKKNRLSPTQEEMPKVQPKVQPKVMPKSKKMPTGPKPPAGPPPPDMGWMNKYRALTAAVQTDWAEAQQLALKFTDDGEYFKASVLLMAAILRDNRGDAQAMSSILK